MRSPPGHNNGVWRLGIRAFYLLAERAASLKDGMKFFTFEETVVFRLNMMKNGEVSRK